MSITVFPVAASSSGVNANSITAALANTIYEGRVTLEPSIYQITCVNTTIANLELYSGAGTLILATSTVSGTVTINLASAADRVRLWTDTGSSVVVTITKTSNALSNVFSGTLDTITSSSTYTGTSTSGFGYAIVIGGGGGGQGGNTSTFRGGNGGGAGGCASKLVALTGSMPIVIGAGGLTSSPAGGGTSGGATTFAGMTANGGSGASGGTATGGTYNQTGVNGATGANQNNGGGAGSSLLPTYSFVVNGTYGSGGAGPGDGSGSGGLGGGSGIGTGGRGALSDTQSGAAATGRGSGGGGGGGRNGANTTGGAGSAGVVYVLRF
jgi:hypothetical protein